MRRPVTAGRRQKHVQRFYDYLINIRKFSEDKGRDFASVFQRALWTHRKNGVNQISVSGISGGCETFKWITDREERDVDIVEEAITSWLVFEFLYGEKIDMLPCEPQPAEDDIITPRTKIINDVRDLRNAVRDLYYNLNVELPESLRQR